MVEKLLLGRVVARTKSGYIVVAIHDPAMRVKIGGKVVDGTGSLVGVVADVIGNVEKPYAVVKLKGSETPEEGAQLFMLVERRRRGAARKGGRKRGVRRGRQSRGRVPPRSDRGHPRGAKGLHGRRKSTGERGSRR